MGLHLSKCQIVGNLMSRLISNTRIPEDDSSVERKSSLDLIGKFYLRKISIIFLPINLNMCFGCSIEPSH